MNKIRTAVVALVVAAGSFAALAFTNSSEQITSDLEFQPHFYGNRGGGQYELLTNPPNPDDCQTMDTNPCIVSSQELLEDGFNWNNRPEDTTPESDSNAIYVGS